MTIDFSWFLTFFSSLLDRAIGLLQNLFYTVANAVISAVATACSAVLALFPSGSSLSAPSIDSSILPIVNWFIPVQGIVASLAFYFSGWLLYIGLAPVLRWFKVLK